MDLFFANLLTQFTRSVPLFLLIGLGFGLSRWGGFSKQMSHALSKFAFNVALTSMLFRIMASMHENDNAADPQLLIAYFGACIAIFFVARLFGRLPLRLNATEASIFGTGCVFANVGLLGLPLAMAMLGEDYIPGIALILSVNAMILWTLVSVTIEFSNRNEAFSVKNFLRTLTSVFKNPLIIAIFSGAVWNLTGVDIPYCIDEPLRLLAASATPLSLIVVGMGLAEYGIGKGLKVGAWMSALKLTVQPLLAFTICQAIGLPAVETVSVVFVAALPCGVNVYLMTKEFHSMEGEVANAMLLSTLAAALTVPTVVTFLLTH